MDLVMNVSDLSGKKAARRRLPRRRGEMWLQVMFIAMFGLMFLGVPIAVAMFISMFVLVNIDRLPPVHSFAQTTWRVASFTNPNLPFRFQVHHHMRKQGSVQTSGEYGHRQPIIRVPLGGW